MAASKSRSRKSFDGPTAEEKIVASLIELMEAGSAPWLGPWDGTGGGHHVNLLSRHRNRGANPILLTSPQVPRTHREVPLEPWSQLPASATPPPPTKLLHSPVASSPGFVVLTLGFLEGSNHTADSEARTSRCSSANTSWIWAVRSGGRESSLASVLRKASSSGFTTRSQNTNLTASK